MSDELQKSKKVRDIRERLGRHTAPPPSESREEGAVAPPPQALRGIAPPPGFVGGQAAKRSGPFGAATSQGAAQQEVRIVVDEQAVATAHEGKSRHVRKLMMWTGGGAALLGLFLGVLATTVMSKRSEYNIAVRDGKAVYEGVRAAADQVAEAKRLLDRAASAARPPTALSSSPTPATGGHMDHWRIRRLPTMLRETRCGSADAISRRCYTLYSAPA